MAVTNEVIGLTTCPDCSASVERRINKNRKVYWHCDGRTDDSQCNAAFKHGAAKSRRLIAEAAKSKPANDNQPTQETINDDKENSNTGDSKRQSAGNDTGDTGKRKSAGGFGLFGG